MRNTYFRNSICGCTKLSAFFIESEIGAVGTSVPVKQEMTRHPDIRTTMNIYGGML